MIASRQVAGIVAIAIIGMPTIARAKPGWADKSDTANDQGHTFICEGEGKTEEDAVATAQGICNDKICKVCGVEVESVTTTSETLKGIDLTRKVVERCKRVRKSEMQVKRKSADCDGQCNAWLEVFYSLADEKAECPSYTKEDFADPALCEQDIEAFRDVKGRTADSFRERTKAMDAALIHCARIDVRPTPAFLSLDSKLHTGLEAFEFNDRMQQQFVEERPKLDAFEYGASSSREAALQDRPLWAWYLTSQPDFHRGISEGKTLNARLQLIRDYVANRALIFDVIEAARMRDLDTPAGVERLRAAMERAPAGGQYGSQDVHFAVLSSFYRAKSNLEPIGALIRKLYDPRKLAPGQPWTTALFFGTDDRVSQEEWDFIFKSEEAHVCVECLRVLLEAKDHGSMEVRLARFDQAYAFVVPRMTGKISEVRAFTNLVGHNHADLLVAALNRVPKEVAQQLTWDFLSSAVFALDAKKNSKEEIAALNSKVVALQQQELERADPKQLKNECTSLADRLKRLEDKGADTSPLAGQACACLTGPLRNEVHLTNRSDLFDWAKKRALACTKGLPE
jgi:hypothetical protein